VGIEQMKKQPGQPYAFLTIIGDIATLRLPFAFFAVSE
jgi:hypothetical protein